MCPEETWNVSLRHLHLSPYRLCFSMEGHGALIYALQNPGMYRSDISILFRTACVSAWGVVGVMVHRRVHRCVP